MEIRRHGFGPHPALRVHGRVHHRDGGRLCWEAHRAQHAVEFMNPPGRFMMCSLVSTCLHRRLKSCKVCVSCDLDGSYLKFF